MLFDAAHLCGMIAGGAWPNPLDEGAHLMTMSTYKSLGGPAGGLIVTNDADLAERLDAIAYPGLTANFDAGKTAALAVTLLDWQAAASAYAADDGRQRRGGWPPSCSRSASRSSPLIGAAPGRISSRSWRTAYGGGQRRPAAAPGEPAGLRHRAAGESIEGDVNGLRIGTPEIIRLGMDAGGHARAGLLISRGLVRPSIPAPWRPR